MVPVKCAAQGSGQSHAGETVSTLGFLVLSCVRERRKRGGNAGRRWAEQRICLDLLVPKMRGKINKQPWAPLIPPPAKRTLELIRTGQI